MEAEKVILVEHHTEHDIEAVKRHATSAGLIDKEDDVVENTKLRVASLVLGEKENYIEVMKRNFANLKQNYVETVKASVASQKCSKMQEVDLDGDVTNLKKLENNNDKYFDAWNASLSLSLKTPCLMNRTPLMALQPNVSGVIYWRDIEVKNLSKLLNHSNGMKKFFRVDVDFCDIYSAISENGLLKIQYDIYQSMLDAPSNCKKYLLLQEKVPEAFDTYCKLIGLAFVTDMDVGLYNENAITVKKKTYLGLRLIKIVFLSLSRSGIDLGNCVLTNDDVMNVVLKYIELLQRNTVNPYVNNVYPWNVPDESTANDIITKEEKKTIVNEPATNAALLSSEQENEIVTRNTEESFMEKAKKRSTEVMSMQDYSVEKPSLCSQLPFKKEPVDSLVKLNKEQTDQSYLPPLLNLIRGDGMINKLDWYIIEYKNIELLTHWSSSIYLIMDIRLAELYVTMYYDGIFTTEEYIYNRILESNQSVYLIFRKLVPEGKKRKPVIGIGKVSEKCADLTLKIIFICASIPQYVDSPWSEEEMFTSGQEVSFKDVRILLDEYKMSLRHKKVKPLFEDLYPWCDNPELTPDMIETNNFEKDICAPPPIPSFEDITCKRKIAVHFTESTGKQSGNSVDKIHQTLKFKIMGSNKQLTKETPVCVSQNGKSFTPKRQLEQNKNSNKDLNDKNSKHINNNPFEARNCSRPQKVNSLSKFFKLKSNQNRLANNKLPETSQKIVKALESNPSNSPSQEKSFTKIRQQQQQKNQRQRRFTSSSQSGKRTPRSMVTPPKSILGTPPRFATSSRPSKNLLNRSSGLSTNLRTPTPSVDAIGDLHYEHESVQANWAHSRHLPPLCGLFDYNKALTKRLWFEIELHNLEHMMENSTNRMEIYLCDTTVQSIQRSFHDSMLEISRKNMENLASQSRSKRYFVLRVTAHSSGLQSPIGVASVKTSNGIIKSKRNDRFYTHISYLCLSIPGLDDLSSCNHYDGMEVYPNVANSFIQQYKYFLSKMKVKPLFPNIFPWCLAHRPQKSPSTTSSLSLSSSSKNLYSISLINAEYNTPTNPKRDEVFDEIPSRPAVVVDFDDERFSEERSFDSYFQEAEVKTVGITFENIQKEINTIFIKESIGYQIKYDPPITERPSKSKSKKWQGLARRLISQERNEKQHQFDMKKIVKTPHLPSTSSRKNGARGRGFWLMKQADQCGAVERRPGFVI